MDWDTLIASIDGPAALSGDINAEARAALADAQARGVPVTLNAPVHRLRRAGFLAEEALARLSDGGDHDARLLAPLYVKTRDLPGTL
jgi:endonuclease/exonuclease/phosphatase (EEP) superfamily protein YafD